MRKATILEAYKLKKLDTLCHADGLTLVEFMRIGRWVRKAGSEYNPKNLTTDACKQMREMYDKYCKNKG